MKASHGTVFEALKAAGPTQADSIARITALAKLLEGVRLDRVQRPSDYDKESLPAWLAD